MPDKVRIIFVWHTAAGYKELEGKTPKEMFKRHGDDRDGGMSLLDETSKDDFDK